MKLDTDGELIQGDHEISQQEVNIDDAIKELVFTLTPSLQRNKELLEILSDLRKQNSAQFNDKIILDEIYDILSKAEEKIRSAVGSNIDRLYDLIDNPERIVEILGYELFVEKKAEIDIKFVGTIILFFISILTLFVLPQSIPLKLFDVNELNKSFSAVLYTLTFLILFISFAWPKYTKNTMQGLAVRRVSELLHKFNLDDLTPQESQLANLTEEFTGIGLDELIKNIGAKFSNIAET